MKKMKTNIYLLVILMTNANFIYSQTQLKKWYYAPEEIDLASQTVTQFISWSSSVPSLINGIYDHNGKLEVDLIDGNTNPSTFRIYR